MATVAVVTFNVGIDPYSVFRTNESMRVGYTPNERYRKVDYLSRNIGKHDSFVLGASTMGLLPLSTLQSLRPEGRWYNLSFLSGTPAEALRALTYLKARGQPIREVVYGIDMFAFRQVGASTDLWRQEHPDITGLSRYEWWKRHAFASSLADGVQRLTHAWLNDQPRVEFDLEGTGGFVMRRWESEIARDHEAFTRKQLADHLQRRSAGIRATEVALIDERFAELRALKAWLDVNGVVSHFWINPMHWLQMETVAAGTMQAYRSKVFEAVGRVPDYTENAEICGNSRNFYELQHFRPVVASTVAAAVLGGS